MPRSLLQTFVVLISWATIAASAADPAKDPQGWGNLRFGMSPKEVAAALGDDGRVIPLQEQPGKLLPLGLSAYPDIAGAKKLAQELLAEEKTASGSHPPKIVEASRELLASLRGRSWTYSIWMNDPFTGERRQTGPTQTVAGPLESLVPDSSNPFSIPNQVGVPVRKSLTIRINPKKTASISETWLEPKSRELLKKIEGLIYDLAMHRFPEDTPQASDDIRPSQIKLNDAIVRGVTLSPELEFDADGKLAKVRLANIFEGDVDMPFDKHGMQRTLCNALEERYGPPDERNNTAASTHVIWRFPNTVIRCSSSEFPKGLGIVRKYVGIAYEVPTEENAQGKEKL